MAVEDHPKYADWRAAHEALASAMKRYDEAVLKQRSETEINLARLSRDESQAAYDKVAAEIDADAPGSADGNTPRP